MSAVIPGTDVEGIARAGYEAYRGDQPLPDFDVLPDDVRAAWVLATVKICELYGAQVGNHPSE